MMTAAALETHSLARGRLISASDRVYVALGNLVVVLALVGYPLSASISQFLGQGNSDLNVAFRIGHVIISMVLIAMTLARRNFILDKLIVFFFALYIIRLWWDLSYSFLPDIGRDIQFFVVATLIPVIAMAGSAKWYDERLCIFFTAAIGGSAGVLIVYNLALGPILAVAPEVNQRASLELLNPISIGYHGLFIALAAMILLSRHRTWKTTIFAVPVVIIGTYLLVVSGSRGPFVALLAGLIVTGLASKRANLAYAVAAIISGALINYFGLPDVISNRFIGTGQDESSLQRIYTLELSIEQALQNPFLGYAYIEPVTARYPHNLIVEAGMALGLGGIALVGWMQISLLFNAWNSARRGQWFIPFLAGAMFANAWISGSLWGSVVFFVTLWLVREQRNVTAAR